MSFEPIRRRLSFANVAAGLALFLGLSGGVAWAAVELSKNSVRAKHIAPGQVRAKHIGKNAVGSSQIRKGAVLPRHLSRAVQGANGLRGPAGAPGPPGPAGPPGPQLGERMGGGLTPFAAPHAGEIPLGAVGQFSLYATCGVSSGYPWARVFVRTAAAGTTVIGGDDPTANIAGGHRFTAANQVYRLLDVRTVFDPFVPKRIAPVGATLMGTDGSLHDVRGVAYVQRVGAPVPTVFADGNYCGFNLVGTEPVSR